LSSLLAGEHSAGDLVLDDGQALAAANFHRGDPVIAIERACCEAVTRSGQRFPYDRLVLAYVNRLYVSGLAPMWADKRAIDSWFKRIKALPACAESFTKYTPRYGNEPGGDGVWPQVKPIPEAAGDEPCFSRDRSALFSLFS
jgi:hypothetical protein